VVNIKEHSCDKYSSDGPNLAARYPYRGQFDLHVGVCGDYWNEAAVRDRHGSCSYVEHHFADEIKDEQRIHLMFCVQLWISVWATGGRSGSNELFSVNKPEYKTECSQIAAAPEKLDWHPLADAGLYSVRYIAHGNKC